MSRAVGFREVAELTTVDKAQKGKKKATRSRDSLPHGRRIFDLNLSDRVEGVWDEQIPLVQQAIIEGVGIDQSVLGDQHELEARCESLCKEFNLTIVESHFHRFAPGISGVYILGESHLAFHSWPEVGYINIDIVTCHKRGVDPIRLANVFQDQFKPASIRCHKIYF